MDLKEEAVQQAKGSGRSLIIGKNIESQLINYLMLDRASDIDEIYETNMLHCDARFVNYDHFTGLQVATLYKSIKSVKYFIANGVLFGPAKAANAGGVAVSGLEMTQNSMRISWDRSDLEDRLRGIMQSIHKQCLEYSTEGNGVPNYVDGANIAGFVKVAEAMLNYGIQ